jgi:hypothetical protein
VDGRNAHVSEVSEPETWIGISADNGERVGADDLAKQTRAEIGVHVVMIYDLHPPRPQGTSTLPSSSACSANPVPDDGDSSTVIASALSAPIAARHRMARKAQSGNSGRTVYIPRKKKTLAQPGEGLPAEAGVR